MFALLDDQQTTLHVHAVDAAGNPSGSFSEPPAWSVDNPSVLTLTPSDDGTSCSVVTTGSLGTATVTVRAGALTDTFPIMVSIDPTMTGLNVTADAPTARPIGAEPPP